MHLIPLSFLAALTLATAASASDGPLPRLTEETKPLYLQLLGEALSDKSISQEQYDQSIRWLNAKPCTGSTRPISRARVAQLEVATARHLKIGSVSVRSVLSADGWYVVSTQPSKAGVPYVFISGDEGSRLAAVATWRGPIEIFRTSELERWVLENVNGVPAQLARCFAWSVSFDRF